jgi:hypothetical protein
MWLSNENAEVLEGTRPFISAKKEGLDQEETQSSACAKKMRSGNRRESWRRVPENF